MESQFLITPPVETVVEESADILNMDLSLITLDVADIRYIAKEASNIVLLEGYANGSCRVSDAIDDATVKTSTVAKGFDLYSANKVLVHLSYNAKKPIFSTDLSELSQLLEFTDMFDVEVMWGIACDNKITDDTVIARLIAANLEPENFNGVFRIPSSLPDLFTETSS